MQKKIELKAKTTNKEEINSGKNIVAALDIGSSKICCFIAQIFSAPISRSPISVAATRPENFPVSIRFPAPMSRCFG